MTQSEISSSSSSSEESQRRDSDDDKLKQALALVDMLKSDYLRVLRENRELRQGISTATASPNDESTCAETSSEANTTSPVTISSPHSNFSSTDLTTYLLPSEASLALDANGAPTMNITPSSLSVFNGSRDGTSTGNLASPLTLPPLSVSDHRVGSRRMPDYYYGLDGQVQGPISRRRFKSFLDETIMKNNTNYRRSMDSGGPVNIEISNTTNSATPTLAEVAVENTTSSMNLKNTSSMNSKSTVKVSPKVTAAAPNVTEKGTVKAATSESSHKIKDVVTHASVVRNKDPIMDEIASELIMELKDDKYGLRSKSNEANESKSSPSMANAVFNNKPKSSIRIHLFKSTRLSIPFNPNNAFCYYHPESMLCKTAIKK